MDEFDYLDTSRRPVYIYALVDPDTHEARYVGKSEAPAKRLNSHMNEAVLRCRKGAALPKHEWLAGLADKLSEPLLAILEETGEGPQQWHPAEQKWIRKLTQKGHSLLNAQVVKPSKRSNEMAFQDALDLGRELFDTDL